MLERTAISTPNAPPPAGPYSQAVRVGSYIHVAGQMGFDPTNFSLGPDVHTQATQTLSNIDAILRVAGSCVAEIVMLRVYLSDLSDFVALNDALKPWFPGVAPARTTVQVTLPATVLVEIDALAVINSETE
ncbi:RidA family protein [Mycobacteroides salmoniphilum]|uniref:RidA family protein n=1 Tax=Mycobacteroides salmoniphilum TaxID=404941 RepID=UPI0010D2A348|nr:RidA family protein [Mycobacteroides salmoniphilum]TDZ99322.1 Enamine/imine deaminase [Mycobacteroides salmoniphilum]